MSMRLTGFSKFLIVAAIVAAIAFGLMKLRDSGAIKNISPKTNTTNSSDSNKPTNSENETQEKTTTPSQNGGKTTLKPAGSFAYQPQEPVNGTLKGVVELGASGFNLFIIRVDKDKNWKQEKAEFGSSLVLEGMTSGKDVKETLKNYIANIVNFGVSTRNIHFVVSSGALMGDKVPEIVKALRQMGYVVNTVTPEQEGKLALACTLPKEYYDNSFVVDIGSGNTKVSWATGSDLASAKGFDTYGAKYFQKAVPDDKVFSEVSGLAAQIPANRREVCFIIGGIPFELAKQTREGKERYTVLAAPEDYTAEGEKQKSGINIYKAIKAKTKCETFVFDWHANFTIGFLLGLK